MEEGGYGSFDLIGSQLVIEFKASRNALKVPSLAEVQSPFGYIPLNLDEIRMQCPFSWNPLFDRPQNVRFA